mgnify:FL=1
MNVWTAALILVLLPPDTPFVDPGESTIHLQALKDTAHLLDLWSRDGPWGPYPTEVRWCQDAHRRVYGAPPLSDAQRLPPREVCIARVKFALDFQNHLEAIQGVNLQRWHEIECAIGEARDACELWTRFAEASDVGCSSAGRRSALRIIRDTIGGNAYYSGRWPCHVPIRVFRLVD